jgi:hypothetical protein
MMFLSVRCLIIYCVPVGAAANSSWDANTVLTCGKTNRTVQSGQSFIFLSSTNAIHSHPDAASTTDNSSTCESTQNPAPGTGRSGNGILDRQGGRSTTTLSIVRHPKTALSIAFNARTRRQPT